MSIQINGIDKPKNCFDCPCIDAEFEECAAKKHYLLPKDEYGAVLGDVPDWCPITELPTCEDAVSRQAAIDILSLGKEILSRVLDDMDVVGGDREKYSWGLKLIESNIKDIQELPSAQLRQTCEYWDSESKFCALCRPSAQPEKRTEERQGGAR